MKKLEVYWVIITEFLLSYVIKIHRKLFPWFWEDRDKMLKWLEENDK